MKIKAIIRFGGKIILTALVLQLLLTASAFAFYNVDFNGGSDWYKDDKDGSNWWLTAWDEDHSPSQDSWKDVVQPVDRWWDW